MLKHFDFECRKCQHVFSDYVEGSEGLPDACPHCGNTLASEFYKLPSACALPSTIVIDYPGSKRLKAGYMHTHARPAEKKESQVSMHIPSKKE